nr:MAG TPA: ArsC family reductase [Caudoviricetes sp.]
MFVLADSSCDYCKSYIFVFVPGYVTGDFLCLTVKV